MSLEHSQYSNGWSPSRERVQKRLQPSARSLLQNMPHHLRQWLGYNHLGGATKDRRPLEAKSTESLPSREVSRGRRPPGAVSSASSRSVSRSRAPPAMTSREVSRGRDMTSSTMSREVSRSRVIYKGSIILY